MESPQIVIGLGNPGNEYRDTRHNIGFRVLDLLARRAGGRFEVAGEMGRNVWTAEFPRSCTGGVVLAKPRTFMNRSGRAAAALARHYGVPPERMIVVYDDADLALGRIRVRPEGGSGGHNGIRSLAEVLGSGAFPRVRLGVRGTGRELRDLADYVLEPFSTEEAPVVEALVELGADTVQIALREGVEIAMNLFNGRSVASIEQSEEE